MNSQTTLLISVLLVPAVIALLLLGVFSYLYQQSRKAYFRAWQLGWAAYLVSYILLGIHYSGRPSLLLVFASKLFFTATIFSIFYSVRLLRRQRKWYWSDGVLITLLVGWQAWASPFALREQVPILQFSRFSLTADPVIALFVLFAFSAWRFFALGRDRKSTGLRFLGASVFFWGLLLLSHQFNSAMTNSLSNVGNFLGPLPQMMVGLAMVMVLYADERRLIEENLFSFSRIELDFSRVLSLEGLAPNMQKLLERLCSVAETEKGLLYVLEPFRKVLPSAQVGFPDALLNDLDKEWGPAIDSLLK